MITMAITKLVDKQNLTEQEAYDMMTQVMQGVVTAAQLAAIMTGLRIKSETADEIAGCARAMGDHKIPVHTQSTELVDTCGTGGDGLNTFNISTTAAFVTAGAGFPVAKHGNRSVSSRSGSADVLEALGIPIDLTPTQVANCIDAVGIGFLFAPTFHPAMRHALAPRRELGFRTIFNILGPLTNPAGARRQVLGVYEKRLTEVVAQALRQMGTKRAFVVHGGDGADELTLSQPNYITEVHGTRMRSYTLSAKELGLETGDSHDIMGGTPAENAAITLEVLSGKEQGPRRSVVLLNAAAAIAAASESMGLKEGLAAARHSVDSLAAYNKLVRLREHAVNLQSKTQAV